MRIVVWILLLALAPALSACGFSPLYGEGTTGQSVESALRDIEVSPQGTRTGQLIRNALLEGIPPAAEGNGPLRLDFSVKEKEGRAIVAGNSDSTQQRLTLDVAYQLVDTRSGRIVHQGSTFADTTYTRTRLPIANERARDSAREALARIIARDIRTRLASYLATHGS